MKIRYLTIIVTAILSTTLLFAPTAPAGTAGQSESRIYGQTAPFEIKDLPKSKLRKRLGNLPIAAQNRAVKWVNGLSFTANDIANMNVEKRVGVFYAKAELAE